MKYRTIVLDPPWLYTKEPGAKSGGTGPVTYAERHYPTMTNEDIAALPVADLAAEDAHIYLWVTNPGMDGGRFSDLTPFDMLRGWGFRYVTMLTWHKIPGLGMGFYFRGDTEHVLFGVRGDLPIASDLRVSNHFAAKKGRHSEKPDRFYEIVERVSPGPWLEVFARRRRIGWGAWGNEAPEESEALTQQHMDLVA